MNFDIPNNIIENKRPEAELIKKVECPERQEVVEHVVNELTHAFQTLGIDNWQLPEIKIKFIESKDTPVLGRVEVHNGKVEIVYDARFSSPESEIAFEDELRHAGWDYPGMEATLKHEFAHVALWSVTGLERQPATRLLDEGWANLVAHTDQKLPIDQTKATVIRGLQEEPEKYTRCLDFDRTVTFEEQLNSAEYYVGEALLLWLHEKFGKEKMIDAIRKSPASMIRFEDDELGETTGGDLSNEGKRFEAALLEITGLQNLDEIRKEFLQWLHE